MRDVCPFKVGDLVTCNGKNDYSITTRDFIGEVVLIRPTPMMYVRVVKMPSDWGHPDIDYTGEQYPVNWLDGFVLAQREITDGINKITIPGGGH